MPTSESRIGLGVDPILPRVHHERDSEIAAVDGSRNIVVVSRFSLYIYISQRLLSVHYIYSTRVGV